MRAALARWLTVAKEHVADAVGLGALNRAFAALDPLARVERAMTILPGSHVLSSSFGAQAAVMLHLVTRVQADIPVVLIDTGYLFPETYRFVDDLVERLSLNLRVYRADASPAWQESRWGKMWEQGLDGIERYNRLNKVEPMERALRDLHGGTWFSGLRRTQAQSRAQIAPVEILRGRYKVHPLFDWTDRDIGQYLKKHELPFHPLWQKGYLSIGDWHTTRSFAEVGSMESLRFLGLKRECGLHEA